MDPSQKCSCLLLAWPCTRCTGRRSWSLCSRRWASWSSSCRSAPCPYRVSFSASAFLSLGDLPRKAWYARGVTAKRERRSTGFVTVYGAVCQRTRHLPDSTHQPLTLSRGRPSSSGSPCQRTDRSPPLGLGVSLGQEAGGPSATSGLGAPRTRSRGMTPAQCGSW
jgi:hypothetical protein